MPNTEAGLKRPLRVRLTIPLSRETQPLAVPGGGRFWNGCEFSINPPESEPCDFWVVMGFAHDREEAVVAPENTLFICGEPPAKKNFPPAFCRQFAHMVDTDARSHHPNLEIFASCLGHGVRLPYDQLYALPYPIKENRVGVLCSSTAKTRGQKKRLRFLSRLKKCMGDDIVHFGRGFRPVENRLDAILPYRFQLVLENSRSPHYWTEKMSSAYVGWAHPIYHGCPNLAEYFPSDAFTAINVDDFEGSVAVIKGLLASQQAESERVAIRVARDRVFLDYGVITRTAKLVKKYHVEAPKRRVVIRGYKNFRPLDRLWARVIGADLK